MVLILEKKYCSKCGKENASDALYCSSCGAPLEKIAQPYAGPKRHDDECFGREEEEECFGIPNGGLIVGVIFGIILILVGIGIIYGWTNWNLLGPAIIIIVGILILVGALTKSRRRRP
uniref:Zinc ribbon domain-containing protein n=1 Tax=Candidatus Methanomethylicus mesodigestus TaxID=1867258 RepID=A0A7C3J4Y1_9CREN